MSENNESNRELIKQNMELTLIITFIGLAFSLVGLLVPTARVMSVVVISVGVIVGFVSYHDAFRAQPPRPELNTSQESTSRIAAGSDTVPQNGSTTVDSYFPEENFSPEEERPVEKPQKPVEEPLPKLPKIQRLPSAEPAVTPYAARSVRGDAETTTVQVGAGSAQILKTRPPRKARPQKPVEVPKFGDKKKDPGKNP